MNPARFPRRPARPARGAGRRARRWCLLLVTAVLAAQALLGAPAYAANPMDCYKTPSPERLGEGLTGTIDEATMGRGVPKSPYDEVGYAGLSWNTYGMSGVCLSSDPMATIDTWLGNQALYAAQALTATANFLHYEVADDELVGRFDGLMSDLTVVLYDHVFTPYLSVVLLLSAVGVFAFVLKGDMAAIGKRGFWILTGLGVASATYLMPMAYTPMVDDVLVGGTHELQGGILSAAGWPSQREGLPTMLHHETIYRPWLAGEFGSDTSPEAQQHGRDLLRAQACTKRELVRGTCNADAKHQQFQQIASQLEHTPAYDTFTTGAKSRSGHGFTALIKAGCYDLVQIMANAGVLLAQIITRAVIIAGPVLGLLAILRNTLLPSVLRSVGTALGMGLLLVVTGAVHAYVLSWIILPTRGLSEIEQITTMLILTIVLWITVRPWRTLRKMAASTVGTQLPDMSQERMARRMRRWNRRLGFGRRGRRRGNAGLGMEFWGSRMEGRSDGGEQETAAEQEPADGTEPGAELGPAWSRSSGQERPEGRRFVFSERVRPNEPPRRKPDAAGASPSSRQLSSSPRGLPGGSEPPDGPSGEPPHPPDGPSPSGGDRSGPNRGPNGPRGSGPTGPSRPPEPPAPPGSSSNGTNRSSGSGGRPPRDVSEPSTRTGPRSSNEQQQPRDGGLIVPSDIEINPKRSRRGDRPRRSRGNDGPVPDLYRPSADEPRSDRPRPEGEE